MKQRIAELKQIAYYQQLIAELTKLRPVVPSYDYKSNNIEEIKVKLVTQAHHDMLMKLIKGE